MPAKRHKVGDKIRVSMHGGKIVEAVIKAIIDKTVGRLAGAHRRYPGVNGDVHFAPFFFGVPAAQLAILSSGVGFLLRLDRPTFFSDFLEFSS
jgi:hypothetical protein